jgi:hypothetical protein
VDEEEEEGEDGEGGELEEEEAQQQQQQQQQQQLAAADEDVIVIDSGDDLQEAAGVEGGGGLVGGMVYTLVARCWVRPRRPQAAAGFQVRHAAELRAIPEEALVLQAPSPPCSAPTHPHPPTPSHTRV